MITDRITIKPTRTWNEISNTKDPERTAVWTADGPLLNQLRVMAQLDDDNAVFDGGETKADFKTTPSVIELAEFARAAFAKAHKGSVTERSTKPIVLLGQNGVQTEFDVFGNNGLPIRMLVAAAAFVPSDIVIISWLGIGNHYYEQRKPEIEKIIAGARLKGRKALIGYIQASPRFSRSVGPA